MNDQNSIQEIKGYCSQCSCWCPIVSIVRDGEFVEVKPDKEHPLACGICPKAAAGPELVYHDDRLKYPMRRTKPKGGPDAGWERISWDTALDTIAERLNEIKDRFGPESIAIARSGPAGSPFGEIDSWVTRFGNALGTPNSIATTHICQWHRDWGSAYTFGNIGKMNSAGRPEFENSACILIWGNNIHATRHSLLAPIKRGLKKGAKLIVVDPRKTEIASMADIWLQVRPGTDGALALGMIYHILQENLYDSEFVENWTNAPFLVRSDSGDFLQLSESEITPEASNYAILGSNDGYLRECIPGAPISIKPRLDATEEIQLPDGKKIECKTVFRLLKELAAEYAPDTIESLTGVSAENIIAAARMFATVKPACWYAWNGIEQNVNAMQTNRAINILYALTGNYDAPGGNVMLNPPATNLVLGLNLLNPETAKKRLGYNDRPLGPNSDAGKVTQAYEIYDSILTGKPYPIKAMIGFGGNIVMSNAPSRIAKEALLKLDFHVQTELFLSPAAETADIVLPVASSWESWHVGAFIAPLGDRGYIRFRPEVIPPRHECRSDMVIIFDLAKRLGMGGHFWNGDVETGFNYRYDPLGITVADLKKHPEGICVELDMEYQKYKQIKPDGYFKGFPGPSKRVEIYSTIFKEYGYDPLPSWKDPFSVFSDQNQVKEKYPLLLTCGKIVEFSHSQHRALPSLRKRVPHPYLEINPATAAKLGITGGEWVQVETAFGSITLKAKLSEGIAVDVVSTQNGWWQGCSALGISGYDPYSSKGANINLLFNSDFKDPISGSLHMKGYPCAVKKLKRQINNQ